MKFHIKIINLFFKYFNYIKIAVDPSTILLQKFPLKSQLHRTSPSSSLVGFLGCSL